MVQMYAEPSKCSLDMEQFLTRICCEFLLGHATACTLDRALHASQDEQLHHLGVKAKSLASQLEHQMVTEGQLLLGQLQTEEAAGGWTPHLAQQTYRPQCLQLQMVHPARFQVGPLHYISGLSWCVMTDMVDNSYGWCHCMGCMVQSSCNDTRLA